jgi:hypothetical protein
MTSPFPGMDPYLERHWGDVHTSLITYARDYLQRRLPRDLRARVEERVLLESPGAEDRSIYPDVSVVEEGPTGPGRERGAVAVAEAGVAVADPVLLLATHEPETQRYVEIIDLGSGGRVVTTIEVLSPSNKRPGAGREPYLEKQRALASSGVSSVEIDLLREGVRTFAVPDEIVPASFRRGYAACVHRGWDRLRYEFYPLALRQRLPGFRIPLRPTDADVVLDLQALVDLCYENGGYDAIDYRAEPVPALEGDDARWADALLREKGLRP